jgi:predicted DNA-binding transcriptional regulator AlpA
MTLEAAAASTQTETSRLIAPRELRERYGITYTRAWLWRLAQNGDFPPPIRLGGNRIAYREDEIRAWINSRPRAVTVRRGGRRRSV